MGRKDKESIENIRIQAIHDRDTVQLRCEPIKGLYKLICATNTGSLKERAQSMMWIYTATLRSHMARWQVQDHIMRKAYHSRGLVTTLNTAKIYASSHTRAPAGYAANSNLKLYTRKEEHNKIKIKIMKKYV